ncbi:alpha/beta fold hydrolase [Lusitaniella coriacea LEGE 07157]|uniref:Alpha/beta fold hydrolase n=1 Tax=Lusitaniella coriacea LEGE 07157 TaxID=945747 RepID=A0A8J7B8W6_9CYAN|nr:alpha/beta fold hydrolase [Lusitaniella coriacea]MBE9115333.1 alpha/beta fold hydrolase [Lusitaniella coriacea LEGE 07157]
MVRFQSLKTLEFAQEIPYRTPWYLKDGFAQTLATSFFYGKTWSWWQERAPWFSPLPAIPWQEQVFFGAEDVPLWGQWSCPPHSKATLILNYGITGTTQQAWYANVLAAKAYAQNWAVLRYDWRSHGKTAELSPVPSSDGWREGEDQVRLARQLITLGCPTPVILAGFSLGGQLVLWGLKAAEEAECDLIRGGVVLSPNLESNRSLDYLQTTWAGRKIEAALTKELKIEAKKRTQRFPHAVKPGAASRVDSIRAFDREMVIDYYGFATTTEYYQKTSGLYLLEELKRPYSVIYAADDPMFDPSLVPELERRMQHNPFAHLLLTQHGGHVSHVGSSTKPEDCFWGLNRMLGFCEALLEGETFQPQK